MTAQRVKKAFRSLKKLSAFERKSLAIPWRSRHGGVLRARLVYSGLKALRGEVLLVVKPQAASRVNAWSCCRSWRLRRIAVRRPQPPGAQMLVSELDQSSWPRNEKPFLKSWWRNVRSKKAMLMHSSEM